MPPRWASGRPAAIISYYDDVEASRVPGLLAELTAGQDVLLITDAGLPGVSDPGYRLVTAAAQAGIRVTVLPGPSAVTTALVISGLPSDRFVFEGFPPRRAGERGRRFAELATEPRTLVFFESPRRVASTVTELAAAFGSDRRAAVCRELTKTHEEVLRGTLAELAAQLSQGVLGEITLVVAGAPEQSGPTVSADAIAEVEQRVRNGLSRKDAIAAVASELGLRKRELYAAVVAASADGLAQSGNADAGGPGQPRDAGGPGQPRDAGGPGQPRDAGGPGQPRDAGGPGQPRDAWRTRSAPRCRRTRSAPRCRRTRSARQLAVPFPRLPGRRGTS